LNNLQNNEYYSLKKSKNFDFKRNLPFIYSQIRIIQIKRDKVLTAFKMIFCYFYNKSVPAPFQPVLPQYAFHSKKAEKVTGLPLTTDR